MSRKKRQGRSVADELLKDATSKLDSALASKPINTNSITAAKMMLETASVKREEAMDELDEIRKRRKSLVKSTHKLLDQALPSKETSKSKRKLESEFISQGSEDYYPRKFTNLLRLNLFSIKKILKDNGLWMARRGGF